MRASPGATVAIDAPLDVVWRVMLDTESYAEWNPFVERVETPTPAAVGNPIVLHVRWTNGRTTRSPERITAIEPPSSDADGATTALLSYKYEGLPGRLGMLSAVRHQRLSQRPGEPTTYDTVEEFAGPLVRFAGPGRVADGFRRHAEGLRSRAEALATQ
jgi:Polyketide cyclase / dehydrase and lipid transport